MAITLLDMLLNSGLINRGQFEEALRNRVVYGGKVGTSLIELGFVREEDLARFLSSKLSVPYVSPEHLLNISPEVIATIPRDLALTYRVIPIHRHKGRLYVVMADPADLAAMDAIRRLTGLSIKPLVAPEVRLIQALGKYYQFHIDRRFQQIISRMEEERTSLPLPSSDASPEPLLLEEEELEEAEIVTEEEWTERIGHYSIDSVSNALAKAGDREEIANILMAYLAKNFERVALFVIRGSSGSGWKAFRQGMELKDFDRVDIPLGEKSALRSITDGKAYFLGTLPDTPHNRLMIQSLGGGSPSAVLLLPLIITGRVVNILYLEGSGEYLGGRFNDIQRLIAKAALAFEILIFREKILMI